MQWRIFLLGVFYVYVLILWNVIKDATNKQIVSSIVGRMPLL